MSKWLFALIALLLVVTPVAAQDEWVTVYAGSGLYSIDLPADWYFTRHTDAETFVGDSIMAAESEDVYAAYLRGEITGDVLTVQTGAIAAYYLFREPIDTMTDEERVMLPFTSTAAGGMGEEGVVRGEIDGYPSASGQILEQYVTYVLADDITYTFRAYSVNDEFETSGAIVDTLDIYPEDAPTERESLVIDGGVFTLPLEPGWLVMEWLMPSRPFGGSIYQMNDGDSSLPRYYLIIPEAYETVLDQLYRDGLGSENRDPVDLAGSLMLLSVYPYDSQFGTAAHTVTDEDRVRFFGEQTRLVYADYDTDARTQTASLGLTTLSADLSGVFNRENNGVLRVYDTNYHLYTLMILAPAAAWDETAPQVDEWLNSVTINPVTSITALDDGIPVGLQVGQRAPIFEMTLNDGSVVSLADFRGKPVVIDFWATWCDPCVVEMPTYRSLAAEHDSFTILAVNSRETADIVSAFVDEHELNFPVALDESGAISDLYRIHAYPTHIVIDSEGVIRAIPAFGTLSERQVISWVDDLQE